MGYKSRTQDVKTKRRGGGGGGGAITRRVLEEGRVSSLYLDLLKEIRITYLSMTRKYKGNFQYESTPCFRTFLTETYEFRVVLFAFAILRFSQEIVSCSAT